MHHLAGKKDRSTNHQQCGGITIVSHQSCPFQPLPPPVIHGTDILLRSTTIQPAIVTPHHRSPFLLAAVYVHPTVASKESGMQAVCDALDRLQEAHQQLPMLIVGDFNARHADWHDDDGQHNSGETALADHINAAGLHIHNQPGMYTRVTTGANGTTKTIIDLVLTTTHDLVADITQRHRENFQNNDHIPFTLELNLPSRLAPPPPPPSRPRAAWDTDRQSVRWQTALPAAMTRHIEPLQPLLDALALRPVVRTPTQADNDDSLRQLQEVYDPLEAAILAACADTVGMKRPDNNGVKRVRWWTAEVEAAFRTRNNAHNRLQRDIRDGRNTDEAHRLAREATERYTEAIEYAKQEANRQFANDCCSPDPATRATAMRRAQPTRATPLTGIKSNDGSMPASHTQSLGNLCSAFIASSTPPPPRSAWSTISPTSDPAVDPVWAKVDALVDPLADNTHQQRRAAQVARDADSDNWLFTPTHVAVQTKRRTKKTSAGPDAILPLFLPYGGESLYKALAAVFNYSWRHSVTPQAWREANVTALYKDKGEKNNPLSYRPISVTSGIVRTLEHLIHDRLAKHIGTELSDTQFGFRARRSTSDAILQLLTSLQTLCGTTATHGSSKTKTRKLRCATLFLDIQKAFDRVDHDILLARLYNIGVRGAAWRWIRSFLSNRRARCVDRQHESDWQGVTYGVPQGCVLSPLLFLVFIDGLVKQIASNPDCRLISTLLYADDGVLGPDLWRCRAELARRGNRVDKFEEEYGRQLKTAVVILNDWCKASRMRFGQEKTQIVVFDRGDQKNAVHTHYTGMQLCGYTIGFASHYEYLGLTLSSDLSWTRHIDRITAKACIASARVSTPTVRALAPHPAHVRDLVCSYILPSFDYGIEYWGCGLTIQQRTKLQARITRPLRVSLSLPTTTHQHSTLFGLGVPDLHTHIQHKQLLHLYRIARLRDSDPTHPSVVLYHQLNTVMLDDHHSLLTRKAAGSAPAALYLLTALLPHVLRPATPPPPPPSDPTVRPTPVLAHHPSPSEWRERIAATQQLSAPGGGRRTAPAHYRRHQRQFESDLQAMCDPAFPKTLRHIRRAAARSTWMASHKPTTAAACAALSDEQLVHRTTAPITHCLPPECDTPPHDSAPPLSFIRRGCTTPTTPHNTLARRARLLFGRSYTADARVRFRTVTVPPTTSALCPHPACTASNHDETPEHLLLHCPYYDAARQQLSSTLAPHRLAITLRTILNPPVASGKKAYNALYTATEQYLDSIVATRRENGLHELDTRLDPAGPAPAAPAHNRRRRPRRAQRRRFVARHSAALLPLDTG